MTAVLPQNESKSQESLWPVSPVLTRSMERRHAEKLGLVTSAVARLPILSIAGVIIFESIQFLKKIWIDTDSPMRDGYRHSAGVTQLVECNLAKVDVASSSLVTRSPYRRSADLVFMQLPSRV